MILLIGKTHLARFMARQRTFISAILVLIATFLVACGGSTVATPPPTYTPTQLEKIQEYATDIVAVRDRAPELQSLIEKKDWNKVGNFIHGPMAEARYDMNYIVSNLLPSEQPQARKVTRDLFNNLVKIDRAVTDGNQSAALSSYDAAYSSIYKFLDLLPQLPDETPSPETGAATSETGISTPQTEASTSDIEGEVELEG